MLPLYMFGHGIGHFIGGDNEDTIKAFFHRQNFPASITHIGTAFFNGKHGIPGEGYHLVQGRVFGSDKAGENLGSAGRV